MQVPKKQSKPARLPVDFHSHILPAMDDGSADVQESLALLAESTRQGISVMVASPHFYPVNEAPESFLFRRKQAIRRLVEGGYDVNVHPRVCVGAEVAYFPGIGRCEDLKRLCVVGTNVVLIEMPFRPWTQAMEKDIYSVQASLGLIPVLVHIDRYPEFYDQKFIQQLNDRGVVIQINASALEAVLTRKRALHMLLNGEAQLLGSDCHNCTTRPQRFGTAMDYILKKAKTDFIPQMVDFNRFLLRGAVPIEKMIKETERLTDKNS